MRYLKIGFEEGVNRGGILRERGGRGRSSLGIFES